MLVDDLEPKGVATPPARRRKRRINVRQKGVVAVPGHRDLRVEA